MDRVGCKGKVDYNFDLTKQWLLVKWYKFIPLYQSWMIANSLNLLVKLTFHSLSLSFFGKKYTLPPWSLSLGCIVLIKFKIGHFILLKFAEKWDDYFKIKNR